ncbi:hypothetical protein [Mucisphaera sp.]|uniref:hypothetical protein n=1 Tax=Mucisphaera sp. TaxID=2913024 RepID=UPI003D0FD3A2
MRAGSAICAFWGICVLGSGVADADWLSPVKQFLPPEAVAVQSGYGYSLDWYGDYLLVGGSDAYNPDAPTPQLAILFNYQTAEVLQIFMPPTGESTSRYGQQVAIGESGVAISAHQEVFFYGFDVANGSWINTGSQAFSNKFYSAIGEHISIDGNLLVVGSDHEEESGVLHIINLENDAPSQIVRPSELVPKQCRGCAGELVPAEQRFGWGLDIDGNQMLVAGIDLNQDRHFTSRGSVYLYDITTMERQFKWQPATQYSNEDLYLGSRVAINGNRSVASEFGRAYLFDNDNGDLIADLYPFPDDIHQMSGTSTTGYYGRSVAIGEKYVAVMGSTLYDPRSQFAVPGYRTPTLLGPVGIYLFDREDG